MSDRESARSDRDRQPVSFVWADGFVEEGRAVVEEMIEQGLDTAPLGRLTVLLVHEDEDPPKGAVTIVPLGEEMLQATGGRIAYVLGRSMEDA